MTAGGDSGNYTVCIELRNMVSRGQDGQQELEATVTFMFAKWLRK